MTDGSNKFLTINSNSTAQNIWLWSFNGSAGHQGSNMSFPELTVTDPEAEMASYRSATKFNIPADVTAVMGPTEIDAPANINAAIDAANEVGTSATDEEKVTFISSDNGKMIKKYLAALKSYGTLSTVNVEMTSEYSTLILPCPSVNASGDNAISWYKGSDITVANGYVTLPEASTDAFAFDTPYIIKATKGNKYTIIGWYKGNTSVVTSGVLSGVLTEDGADVPTGSYVLATEKASGVQAFYLADGIKCPQYHCYLTPAAAVSGPGARVIYIDGEATAISGLNANVNANAKDGKYIQNGRMVIVSGGKKFNAAGQIVK